MGSAWLFVLSLLSVSVSLCFSRFLQVSVLHRPSFLLPSPVPTLPRSSKDSVSNAPCGRDSADSDVGGDVSCGGDVSVISNDIDKHRVGGGFHRFGTQWVPRHWRLGRAQDPHEGLTLVWVQDMGEFRRRTATMWWVNLVVSASPLASDSSTRASEGRVTTARTCVLSACSCSPLATQ